MLEILNELSGRELLNIGGALRTGRLSEPFSALSIQTYCGAQRAAAVSQLLKELSSEGMKTEHAALIFESAAQACAHGAENDERLELVWTGPPVPNLATRDTGVVVRELFSQAQHDVLIACYAIYQGEALFQILAERMDSSPELRVRMYLNIARGWNDTTESSELVRRYAADFKTKHWSGRRLPEIYYDPRALSMNAQDRANLHAKSIVIDGQKSLISSANFTEAAQTRNIELGVVVDSASIAAKIGHYFEALLHRGLLLPLSL